LTKTPKRRCIVCRASEEKAALSRFVFKDPELIWDRDGKLGGRGFYVHRRLNCFSSLSEPKRLEHALRLQAGSLKREQLKGAFSQFREELERLSLLE